MIINQTVSGGSQPIVTSTAKYCPCGIQTMDSMFSGGVIMRDFDNSCPIYDLWIDNTGSKWYSQSEQTNHMSGFEIWDEWTFREGQSQSAMNVYCGGIKGTSSGKLYCLKEISSSYGQLAMIYFDTYGNEFHTFSLTLPSVEDNIYDSDGNIDDTVSLVYDSVISTPVAFNSENSILYFYDETDTDKIWWRRNGNRFFTPTNKFYGPMRMPIFTEEGIEIDYTPSQSYVYNFLGMYCSNGIEYVYDSGSSYGGAIINMHDESGSQAFIDAHDFYVGQSVYSNWDKSSQIGVIEQIYKSSSM